VLKAPSSHDTGAYLEALQHDISLSIPISESCRSLARSAPLIVNEIRECLRELRTTLLRELSTEIVPKFFSSNEFEMLLWELDAHKLYLLSQNKASPELKNTSSEEGDEEEDELVRSFSKITSHDPQQHTTHPDASKKQKPTIDSIGPAVPDGAVQRLLRKVSSSLPSTITMHRAPLDLMESVPIEREAWNDEPMGWFMLFDTEGGRLQHPISLESKSEPSGQHGSTAEKVRILSIAPLYADKGQASVATTNISSFPIIPEGIVNFLLPNGRCITESKGSDPLPHASLINLALATRDNAIMYGGSLQLYRKETVYESVPTHPDPHLRHEEISRSNNLKNNSHLHTPAAIHHSHRPSHTPQSTFKPLSPTSPSSGYTEWIGQMSLGFETMKNKNPFFDRFKDGITTMGGAVNKQVIPPPSLPLKDENMSLPNHAPHSIDSVALSTGHGYETPVVSSPRRIAIDLHVVYGLAIITKVPCVNALRTPLALLASDPTFLQELSRKFQEGKSTSTTPEWPADVLAMVQEVIEKQQDSLRALRFKYHQYSSLLASRIPSVMRSGGAHDMDARMILNTLTPRNFVTILIAFLLEYKIAVISSKVTVLTVMGEFLKSIIAPLKWSHVYVPLIPKQFNNDILQCPTPFFVGIQREFFDASAVPHDVIILDLDSDACRITSDLAKALYAGRLLAEALEKVLRPSLMMCDDIITLHEHEDRNLIVHDVLRLCKLFIADLLIGTEECCTHAVDHNELVVLFDEAMFSYYKMKRSKGEEMNGSMFPFDQGFLEQFMRTQCFSLCVVGNILKKLDPNSRPPSRPSSPFVSIPSPPMMKPSPTSSEHSALPTTPVQYS
jgi:hypothetical protein